MIKIYICLHTCAVTRALHLEITESLNTSPFIHCFRRFVGRRGMPSLIVSDNANTLKGAARFLRKLMNNDEVRKYLEDNNVDWKFNFMAHSAVWGHPHIQRENTNPKMLTVEKLSKRGLRRCTKFGQVHSIMNKK